MRSSGILVGLAIAVALTVGACASTTPNPGPEPTPPAGPDSGRATTLEDLKPFLTNREKDYPLYPGDEIRISVQGHDELSVERRIPVDGRVPLFGLTSDGPSGGAVTVMAAGRRVTELEAELRRQYSRNFTNPYVTVRVLSYAPKKIYVAGAVTNPKDYRIPDEERISLVQALTMAGWFTEGAAPDRVRVIRRDPDTGDRIHLPPIDVTRIVSKGEVAMDILLDPGDTITVDSRESRSVSIFGYVESPGEVPWTPDLTLTRLISRVGGLKEYAKLTNIRILRPTGGPEPRVFVVDLKRVFEGEEPDFALRPGDVVKVDETFF